MVEQFLSVLAKFKETLPMRLCCQCGISYNQENLILFTTQPLIMYHLSCHWITDHQFLYEYTKYVTRQKLTLYNRHMMAHLTNMDSLDQLV